MTTRPLIPLSVTGKRTTASRPEWQFFVVPVGNTSDDARFPDKGLKPFGGEREGAVARLDDFITNMGDGCGEFTIGAGISADIQNKDAALVCGLVIPESARIVAALTLSVGHNSSSMNDYLDRYERRYRESDGAWLDGNGQLTPLVDPKRVDVGAQRAYKERLYLTIEHFCTVRSAENESSRLYGTGTQLLANLAEYLIRTLVPHMRATLKKVEADRDQAERIHATVLDALPGRDLRLHLDAVQSARGFYTKRGFEVIPAELQNTLDPSFLFQEKRMWAAVTRLL